MAAPSCKLLVQRIKAGLPSFIQVRWSRYNPQFLDPVPDKEKYRLPIEELSKEEREEWELKAVRPIKACPPGVSSSVFSDPAISKFTNMMMKGGEKILARQIMNKTLEKIKRIQLEKYYKASPEERENIQCNPYVIFNQAVEQCTPIIGLTSILKGGKSYQVPVPLTDQKRRFMAMKWIITEGREKKARRTFMYDRLADILLEAWRGEGNIVKRKHDLHKMAEANRAFAHFRWW
ncbi:28S ribosomal protein S7, mitochondrial [Bufo gargarizans]|uniref:28S ribosomal protein S7, mitochondrial n=1 Tax=Bufo gargarizans TaxID=30331 RepID=UPI001CF59235|nr:28S ribosomal protein S7, mitochondrial [Bufo gargarizans]